MIEKTNPHSDFAVRLNKLMKNNNFTINDLKNVSKVTYEMARRYTLGTAKPRDQKMIKIANWLSVSPAYLDYGIPTNNGKNSDSFKNMLDPQEIALLKLFASLPREEKKNLLISLDEKKQYFDTLFEELATTRSKKIN